jgi:hypothetical protein
MEGTSIASIGYDGSYTGSDALFSFTTGNIQVRTITK